MLDKIERSTILYTNISSFNTSRFKFLPLFVYILLLILISTLHIAFLMESFDINSTGKRMTDACLQGRSSFYTFGTFIKIILFGIFTHKFSNQKNRNDSLRTSRWRRMWLKMTIEPVLQASVFSVFRFFMNNAHLLLNCNLRWGIMLSFYILKLKSFIIVYIYTTDAAQNEHNDLENI